MWFPADAAPTHRVKADGGCVAADTLARLHFRCVPFRQHHALRSERPSSFRELGSRLGSRLSRTEPSGGTFGLLTSAASPGQALAAPEASVAAGCERAGPRCGRKVHCRACSVPTLAASSLAARGCGLETVLQVIRNESRRSRRAGQRLHSDADTAASPGSDSQKMPRRLAVPRTLPQQPLPEPPQEHVGRPDSHMARLAYVETS